MKSVFSWFTVFRKPNVMKQKNAFPPNFIHSLDSTHMMLTTIYCLRSVQNNMAVRKQNEFWQMIVSCVNGLCLRHHGTIVHSHMHPQMNPCTHTHTQSFSLVFTFSKFFFLISRSTDFSWFMFYKQCLVKLWKDDLLCFKQFVPSLCVHVENSIAFLQGWNHICVGARLFLDTSLWCGYHE